MFCSSVNGPASTRYRLLVGYSPLHVHRCPPSPVTVQRIKEQHGPFPRTNTPSSQQRANPVSFLKDGPFLFPWREESCGTELSFCGLTRHLILIIHPNRIPRRHGAPRGPAHNTLLFLQNTHQHWIYCTLHEEC